MKFILQILIFLVITIGAGAQNLVINGGFEDAWTCPYSYNTLAISKPYPGWLNPNKGTPDHLHACSVGDAGVPFNFAGFMFPAEGSAYAGIILRETFDDSLKVYDGVSREYIQTKLKSPLQKDKLYCVKLSYANSSKSVFSVDALGITLTTAQIGTKDAGLIIQRPQIINKPGHIMDNSNEWQQMCGVYRSRGNEKFLTIGNFWDNSQTGIKQNHLESTDSAFFYAYYYIDDVHLFEIENTFECGCLDNLSFGSDWMADNYDPETGYNTKIIDLNENLADNNKGNNNSPNGGNSNNINGNSDLNGNNGNNVNNGKSNNDGNDNNTKQGSDLKGNNKGNNSNEGNNSDTGNDDFNGLNNNNPLLINMKESEITAEAFSKAGVGSKFNLNRIFFEFNSSELLSVSYAELDKLTDILNSKAALRIEIRGHTDNVGSESYNKTLSIKRAQSVYDYLLAVGIAKGRMKYRGFGTRIPVSSNDTDEGRSQNRRVEIVVVEL